MSYPRPMSISPFNYNFSGLPSQYFQMGMKTPEAMRYSIPGTPGEEQAYPATPATPMMDATPVTSRTLADYEIIKTLGEGGQGAVYLARVRETGKIIALKVLKIKNDTILKQARIEIQNLIKISKPSCHPNLSCYYDYFYDSNTRQMLIEMEYIEGEDLEKWGKRILDSQGSQVLYAYLLAVMIKLLEGLSYVHATNLIHRDIKPGNIMISKNEEVKLVDFGLACQTRVCPTSDPDIAYTCCYGKAGTPGYMAPETIRGESYFATDIWSLGVTIFGLASGNYPFLFSNDPNKTDDENNRQILDTILETQPFSLTTSNTKLNLAVNSMLDKNFLNRIQIDPLLKLIRNRN